MELYDSHCHLDPMRFGAELPDVLARARAAGVTRLTVIGTRALDSEAAADLASRESGVVAAAGIHPNDVAEAEPEVRAFDPKSALIAPEEGLADLRRILTDAPKFLRAGGWVLCETGIDQHVALAELSAQLGYAESAGLPDMSGRPRFWKAKKD